MKSRYAYVLSLLCIIFFFHNIDDTNAAVYSRNCMNIFRIAVPLCGDAIGHWWIPPQMIRKAGEALLFSFMFYIQDVE